MSKVGEARAAVARGANDEALVLLWNELEPARLADDRSALATIEALAHRIATQGDEAQRREAERLLETLGAASGQEATPATARIEGAVTTGGERVDQTFEQETRAKSPARGLGTIVWLLLVLAVILFNVLSGFRD